MWQVRVVTFKPQDVDSLRQLTDDALSTLDANAVSRLQRYFRKEDTFRGLVGRLLPRVLLKECGIPPPLMAFGITSAGKPYMDVPTLDPSIGYSVTHDHGVIAMAFARGNDLHSDPPSYKIGVDVMKINLPKRHTFKGFVEVFTEQLTVEERGVLLQSPLVSEAEGLRRFYLIWTLKEAYTKALGIGLGFEFKRISYDVVNDTVCIDGIAPDGWEFTRFELTLDEESYVGFAVRYLPDKPPRAGHVLRAEPPGEWLKVFDAKDFLEEAVKQLKIV